MFVHNSNTERGFKITYLAPGWQKRVHRNRPLLPVLESIEREDRTERGKRG